MIDKKINNNKKGFTLIELIAVITIILVISISSVLSYSKILQSQDLDEYDRLLYTIESAAKTYMSISNLACGNYKLFLDKLKTNGLIASNLVNPKNKEEINYLESYVEISTGGTNKNCLYKIILK